VRRLTQFAGLTAGALVLAVVAGCSADEPTTAASTPTAQPESSAPPPAPGSATVAGAPAEVTVAGTVAEDLVSPWGLVFLPDGSALVSERDTREIKRIGADGTVTTVGQVPDVEPRG
jgi:glucose/arabinose dehydrogenase